MFFYWQNYTKSLHRNPDLLVLQTIEVEPELLGGKIRPDKSLAHLTSSHKVVLVTLNLDNYSKSIGSRLALVRIFN